MKKTIGALATAGLAVAFVAGSQLPASAHTPTLAVDCGYVALQLTGYPAGSFTSAVVDGKTVWSETFGAGGFQDSVNFDPKVKHTYTVTVKSGDGDPRYSSVVSGATPEACYAVTTPPVEHTPEPTPEPTPPVVTPPVEPPVVVPPVEEPPVVTPPVEEPPVTTPPVTEPPVIEEPPVVVTPELPEETPITEPETPVTEAPIVTTPIVEETPVAVIVPAEKPTVVAASKTADGSLAFTGSNEERTLWGLIAGGFALVAGIGAVVFGYGRRQQRSN